VLETIPDSAFLKSASASTRRYSLGKSWGFARVYGAVSFGLKF